MKASITQSELNKALGIVSKGASSRSTLPILSGIYIKTTDDGLFFQTTDLEISIKTTTKAFVEEEGAVVVPSKLLIDVIKSLPDAAVTLSTEANNLFQVECGNSVFNFVTMDADDFPAFPEINPEQGAKIPSAKLATMVKNVGKVVSKDESRAVLTGILFSVIGTTVKLVSTDSYRLALSEDDFAMEAVEPMEAIIPGRTLTELMRSAENEKEVFLGITENQVVFEFGTTTFVSRKIEGKYPNYKQLIPTEKSAQILVNTQALVAAVKRVSLMAQAHAPIKVVFDADNQRMQLVSQSTDLGTATEQVEADIQGDSVEIGFNHQYILDGLLSITSELTRIEVQSSLKPGIFKSEDGKYLYLAMPVRLG